MTVYPQSAHYYDNLINDVVMNAGHCQIPSLGDAMKAWQTFGSALQDVFRPAGTPSNGTVTSDGLAPQLSVADLVKKYLSGWTGSASQEFVNQADLVRDFGHRIGATMYDPGGGKTFHAALKGLSDALTYVHDGYSHTTRSYAGWASALAGNLVGYVGGTFGNTDQSQSLSSDWTPTTSISPPSVTNTHYPSCTLNFTIYDGQERQTVPVPGAIAVDRYVVTYSVTSSSAQISKQLTSSFTRLLAQKLGLLADKITSNSGAYTAAGQALPGQVDASRLPPGGGNNPGQGTGSGSLPTPASYSGTLPSGDATVGGGFDSHGGGSSPAADLTGLSFGGLHGTGSASVGGGLAGPNLGGLVVRGTGSGGAGATGIGPVGAGGAPTRLAGFPGGTSGAINGLGGMPVGGASATVGAGLGSSGVGGMPPGGASGLGSSGLGSAGVGSSGLGPPALGSPVVGPLVGGLSSIGGFGGSGGSGGAETGGLGSVIGSPEGLSAGGVVAAGTAAEPAPMMPPMMPPPTAGRTDNGRQRWSWLADDGDVWAADAAVPPVISAEQP